MGVKSLNPNQKQLLKEVSRLVQSVSPPVCSVLKYKTHLVPCNIFLPTVTQGYEKRMKDQYSCEIFFLV